MSNRFPIRPDTTAERQVLSVSQLNRQARMTIEQRFNQIWVSGELSSFARPGSGHWYFTLKDNDAQVRCAMFANANRRARMQPANGQQVLLRGRVSLYEGRGEFQIIVEHMEPAGEGALRAAVVCAADPHRPRRASAAKGRRNDLHAACVEEAAQDATDPAPTHASRQAGHLW